MGFYIQDGKLTGFDGKEEKVVIPKNVRTIQDNTFENKEHIVNIQIPKEVLSIGVGVSYNCPLLLSIDVDNENPHYKSVDGNLYTKDGKILIQYATGKRDRNFDVPEGVEEISPYAFYGAKHLHSVKLPNSITEIGECAFFDCVSLDNISLVEGICKIHHSAFANCHSLKEITIPSSITYISYGAFSCSGLINIEIPNSITSISLRAFQHCTLLKKINIPSSVTYIGEGAFDTCDSLEKINIPSSVKTICKGAFRKCKNLTIYCEAEKKPKGWKVGWKSLGATVIFGAKSENANTLTEEKTDTSLDFKIKGGVLEEYSGNDKIVTVPNDVTEIAVGVFSGKSFIKLIVLPSGLTKIGTGAFTDCKGLEKIVIPKSVEIIERTSFSGCENLVICCERGEDEIPDGWNNTHYGNWNVSNCPIVWEYTNK